MPKKASKILLIITMFLIIPLSACSWIGGSSSNGPDKEIKEFIHAYYNALSTDSNYDRLVEMTCQSSNDYWDFRNKRNNGTTRKNSPQYDIDKIYSIEKQSHNYYEVQLHYTKKDNNQYSNKVVSTNATDVVEYSESKICMR